MECFEGCNNGMKRIIIAIDGFSSSGKSTMARALASRIGYRYIDSGAMYRAVTLYALEHGIIDGSGVLDRERLCRELGELSIDFKVCGGGQHTMLNGRDVESEIRGMAVSSMVSRIAAEPCVRERLTAMQQEFGRERGIVMDGRDIGTTVFPDAELKVYVNAPAETRARRRWEELRAKGDLSTSYDDVLANVRERDHLDCTREQSPLRRADDAVDLDNSEMSIAEQDAWLLARYEEACRKVM